MNDTSHEQARPRDTVIFDIDGTLIDSNYHHALAWARAFRRIDLVLPLWEIHRGIGMGGDQFVEHVAGADVEREHGDMLRKAWADEFAPMQDEVRPLPGSHDVLEAMRDAGFAVVLASSGNPDNVSHALDLLDAREIIEGFTTSEDVRRTKPAPDLLKAALDKASGDRPIMIGDSVWDVEAANRISVPSIAVLTGGFAESELAEAGAAVVHRSLADLAASIGTGLLQRPVGR